MATTEPRGGGDKPVSETRQGNKDKFAWFYAMLADRKVTNAGKAVGAGCVMKLAGSKGHFKATRKAIANLCGMSQATARLGLASLIDNRYLRADLVEGAASTYYLIHPDAREQLWLDAERDYKRAIHEWLYAEKWHNDKQVQNQLLAEKQFRQFQDAVFKAAINRGIPDADAHRVAGRFLEKYGELGYELDPIAGAEAVNSLLPETVAMLSAPREPHPVSGDQKLADPGYPASRPRLADWPTPASRLADPGYPASRPRLMPKAASSANDQTHKSFKDSESPVKDFQDSKSGAALRGAPGARPPRPPDAATCLCDLCDDWGDFQDPHGHPVVLIDDDLTEYPVQCQHSFSANLAHIQRREILEDRSLCKTGWREIDSHYPALNDDDDE